MTGSSLTGKRVVVTRRREQSRALVKGLRSRGALPIECPTIKIASPLTWGPVDSAVTELAAGSFRWTLFTSVNAVDAFLSRDGAGAALARVHVGAVGKRTQAALEEAGVEVDLVPETRTGAGLGTALGTGEGRVLLPRAEEVPPVLADLLEANGWTPHPVTVYRTVAVEPPGPARAAVEGGRFEAVTFTSASTVRGFSNAFPDLEVLGPDGGDQKVAVIGEVTAAECHLLGIRVDAIADEPSNEALLAALEAACRS